MNYTYNENILKIGQATVTFGSKIYKAKIIGSHLIVILDMSDGCDNIYSVDSEGKIEWKIQKRDVLGKAFCQDPYVGVSFDGEALLAIDYYGRKYKIAPENGHIIERYTLGRDW